MTVAYLCPVCHEVLAEEPAGYLCTTGHSFDRAREGYVNLLPSGRLKGRPSGDSEPMVRARRTVFDAGLYQPIIETVADAVAEVVRSADLPNAVLDCGCGEGAYLAAAAERSHAQGWGIDVAKPAVRLAARRHRELRFAVASTYGSPFPDGSFGAALSVFSPRPFAEMMRVLAVGGAAVVVTPGEDHLHQLKALVYDDPRRHGHADAHDEIDLWPIEADRSSSVRFDLRLDDSVLRVALLEMTPFWWSTTPDQRALIAAHDLTVTVDIRLAVHRKRG